jgi:hypothetical protein
VLANSATQKRNIDVDMWTTQARCPHAHNDNNRRKQLSKFIKLKSPTRRRDEANNNCGHIGRYERRHPSAGAGRGTEIALASAIAIKKPSRLKSRRLQKYG